ncbi:MAG TPA: peptidyl-prolyl cis-trans isomerase [Candidatus Acidoferrales bacterium]|jgi:peptidyl-prolyl cis-trans isomerase D|nr:peptidyl-prolyl cis-trans isomerase [Candidatus Acidoferrales bacterium]
MFKSLQQRNTMVKWVLGFVLGAICLAMVLTLAPLGGVGSIGNSPDTVANVGGQAITVSEVQQTLKRETSGQNIPKVLQGIYARQVLDQLIYSRLLEMESTRLGIQVTPQEQTERIRQLFPTVFNGDTWVSKDRYISEVEQRTGMSVPEFEELIRQALLEEKFRSLITDGVSVTPAEVEQEYRWRNEKIKIGYVLLKPADLASSINPSEAELAAYFAQNQSRYPVPERRSARFALLDLGQLRQRAPVSQEEILAYYNQHLDDYKVQDRVHVEHILFKTVGKTDAEILEVRQKAEDALKKAKHGGNFEEIAKKESEDDATKPKGGDLGWIVRGQTVAEFEQAAFTLPKGSISDLVKTQYGFHIIKIIDRETARTKTVEEVRIPIAAALEDKKVQTLSDDLAGQMARAVRESNRQKLDDLAKKFGLELGETPPADVSEPVGDLGNSPELHQILSSLRPGELSAPIHVDRGFAILTVKDIVPAHAGTLAEVHDKVLADYRQGKSLDAARTRADEIARRTRAGEPLEKVAKSLNAEFKTSDPFARNGSVTGIGSAQQLSDAFTMSTGQVGGPTSVAGNWVVYQVLEHQAPNPDDLTKQLADLEQQLLQQKRSMVYEAFRKSLMDRMRQSGKVAINADVLKRLTTTS